MEKKDYELDDQDYKHWDRINRFTVKEIAYLWFNVCPLFNKTPISLKNKIEKMKHFLQDAFNRGELIGGVYTPNRETVIMQIKSFQQSMRAISFPQEIVYHPYFKFTRDSLRAYAESIGEKPLFLFPEERGKQSYQENIILPCKPNTKWEDISITLVADDMVIIKTPQGEGRYTYHQLGMEDKRKGDQPTMIWCLLKLFAQKHGNISSENPEYDPKLPDTAKRLNNELKKNFGINESIYTGHYKKEKGYKTKIKFYDRTYPN